jgi:crotonobetainyl-CoA:carnitine CoA-transferase CaiB-like acyl-CoA transferase
VTTKELAKEPTGPLKGVKIVDMTSVVFGAYATQILGDMGADVIKVESPAAERGEGGDIMRWTGATPEGAPHDLGPIFMTINRNKRSVLIDLNKESAKRALTRLIESADVFAVTVRMDGMKRLGLDYESVKKIKPDIIYVHGAGYGADGPYAGLPAYDDLIQAQSGFADLLNRTDGEPKPRYMPSLIADKASGLFFANAVTAALFHRARTGEGQFVEVPMYECMVSFNLAEHMFGHVYDPPTGQWSYVRVTNPDRRPFKTKDGHIGLLPYTQKQWAGFFTLAGWPELINDERFSTQVARARNIRELYGMLEVATVTKTSDEWIAALQVLGVPVVKVNRLDDLREDPHLAAVGMFERYEHPEAGTYYALKPPIQFEKTPSNIRRHPPRLGEHTAEFVEE